MFSAGLVGLVLAGGHGFVTDQNRSKLVEPLDAMGKVPLVSMPVGLLALRLGLPNVHVVVNGRFAPQVQAVLGGCGDLRFVHQPRRTGTAGAVSLMLESVGNNIAIKNLVVLYGDMPLWRPESIAALIASHYADARSPVISMFEIESTAHVREPSGGLVGFCTTPPVKSWQSKNPMK